MFSQCNKTADTIYSYFPLGILSYTLRKFINNFSVLLLEKPLKFLHFLEDENTWLSTETKNKTLNKKYTTPVPVKNLSLT